MSSFYLDLYQRFPEFLKRLINPLEYEIRTLAESARDRVGRGVLLDAGSGEGRFRSLFQNARYIALDSGVGDQDWDYSQVDLLGDLRRIPLAGCSVDVVLNLQVLEHVKEPARVLCEFVRILRPEGVLFLTAPQGWPEHQQPNDYFRFTRFALEELLREAGFKRIRVEPIGGYFYYLGNRLTFLPKVLFPDLSLPLRIFLFPLELLCLGFSCFILPIFCYGLDRFDRKREFTLCYKCRAQKD